MAQHSIVEAPERERRPSCARRRLAQAMDPARAEPVHHRRAGEHRVLHGFAACGRRRHRRLRSRRSAPRRRTQRAVWRPRSTTARASSRTRVCCCATRSSGVRKPDLLHQVGRVARPALGHRAAAEHPDAAGAVDRRDLPDRATRDCVGVRVLHVMADRAVVDDVIQLDRAVVRGAQAAILLGVRDAVDRRDDVVVHRQRSNGAGER